MPFPRIVAIFAHGLEHRTPFGAHGLNMALNIGFGFFIDNRSNIGGQAARVTHAAFRHRAAQHFQRMVGYIVLQTQDAKRRAALPGAVKGRSQDVDHHLFRQCGGVDDHGVHPTGFGDKRDWTSLSIQAGRDIALQQRGNFR